MTPISRLSLIITLVIGMLLVFGAPEARADSVTFSTMGVMSVSGTNVATFLSGAGMTTLTFNGTTNPVDTPAGASFGDLVVTTTVPADTAGPAVSGTLTLTIMQTAPAGSASLVGTLSGNLGFNTGIATLNFSSTSVSIGPYTYTVNPTYTIALPVTGVGGGASVGTTTIQGTVTGSQPVPEPTSMLLLGAGLIGLAGAVRRRRNR